MSRPAPPSKTGPAKPRKAAIKFCHRGHRQVASWKPGRFCSGCFNADREILRALSAKADREEWLRRNGPTPAVLSIIVVSTGKRRDYAIPRGLMRRPARNGPKRRRSV